MRAHREEYAAAYPNLRIYQPEQSTNGLRKLLEQRDKELAQLRESLAVLSPLLEFASRSPEVLQGFLSKLDATEKQIVLRNLKWFRRTSRDKGLPDDVRTLAHNLREKLKQQQQKA